MKIGRFLAFPVVLFLASCASYQEMPIRVIPRPHLIPLTVEMQQQIPVDALDIIAVNQEVLKNHIKRLESRITLHDESL